MLLKYTPVMYDLIQRIVTYLTGFVLSKNTCYIKLKLKGNNIHELLFLIYVKQFLIYDNIKFKYMLTTYS